MQRLIILFGAVVLLASCASQRSYLGVPISASDIKRNPCEQSLQDIAQCYRSMPLGILTNQARIGDKEAQLELGIRFENGRGVCTDADTALALYKLAAQDSPRKRTSFIPDGGSVRAETTSAGVDKGLPEAQRRFRELRAHPFGVVFPIGSPCASTNRNKR